MHEEDDPDEVSAGPTPAGEDERLVRSVLRVCDAVGTFIEYWGFKAIHGRVWALLALRAEPMAQIEIAQMLGVSRSLISGAIAELTTHGLVRAVGDHRNAPYIAVMDFWPTIADVLRSREWMLLEQARLALEAAVQAAERSAEAGTPVRFDVGRMQILLALTELGQTLLRTLISARAPRVPERLGGWLRGATGLVRKLRRAV
ncbi:MAG: MarR family transcriptional regulator [Myxococcales bacterium]|nr:MarR family transcriptional regulator [Myxococcales bacterium]